MVAAIRPRPYPTLIVLAGIAAFGLGLLTMLLRAPTPGAHAQGAVPSDCPNLNPDGCAITFEVPALAIINDPAMVHTWLVDVPEGQDFSAAAANLPADFELSVYGPDGTLIALSNRPGYQDEILNITNVGAGTYSLVVDSPGGDWSSDAYTVLATTATLIEAPFDPYGNPSQYILAY